MVESLAVLFVVSLLVYGLINLVPGNPGRNALGPAATAQQVAAWNAAHGVQAPSPGMYVEWLQGFLTGNWGTSLVYGVPVFDLVIGRLGNSVVLGLLAFAMLVPVAIGIGVMQARVAGSRVDRSTTVGLMTLAAVPEFVIGGLLLVVFGVVLDLVPIQPAATVSPGDRLPAMVLPAATLALGAVSIVARVTRSSIVNERAAYHYRVAEMAGLSERTLFTRHVARNALVPTVALLGLCLAVLLAGSVVVETLFGYPGLGELLVTAAQRKDAAALTAGVMVTGIVSLAAIAATDAVVALLAPRSWASR